MMRPVRGISICGAIRRLAVCGAAVVAALTMAAGGSAATVAPVLTITPITWNVIGLDSNNQTVGPNEFPVGVRVCNTGTAAATGVSTTFVWDSANANISLVETATRSHSDIPTGGCRDIYYTATVTRTSSAFDTSRRFSITASATDATTVSTPTPRELYVERLVSQGRNSIISVTGPSAVRVGQTVTYTVTTKTATQGYEQLFSGSMFPTSIFRVVSTAPPYSSPSGATNTTLYANACGWNPVPGTTKYLDCIGPNGYTGGKAGGNPITTTYTLEVIGSGSASVRTLIYDFSGSSYHYNSDFSTYVTSITSTVNQAPVAVDDSASTTPGTPTTVSVLANDTDANGDTLTITGNTGATNGTVTCSATTCTYTPGAGFSGVNTFTYTISDGYGGTATATVTITVGTVVPAFGIDSPLPVALLAVGLGIALVVRRSRRPAAS